MSGCIEKSEPASAGDEAVSHPPRPRMLIVYFGALPSRNNLGPAVFVENLARAMISRFDIEIISLNYDVGTKKALFDAGGYHVETAGRLKATYLPFDFRRFAWLRSILLQKWDVVLLNCAYDPRLAIPTLLLLRFYRPRQRAFHVPHGIFMQALSMQGRWKKRLFRWSCSILGLLQTVVHVASVEAEAEDIKRELGDRQKVIVLPQFPEVPLDRIPRPGKPANTLKMCLAGRVAAQKNILGAISMLHNVRVSCELDVFGDLSDQTYVEQCRRQIAVLPPHVKVGLLGLVDRQDLLRRMEDYDLFFLPTLGENFGHSIIEALGRGVPVLISDRCPWTDLAENGAGWCFPLSEQVRFREVIEQVFALGDEWSFYQDKALSYAKKLDGGAALQDLYFNCLMEKNEERAVESGV
jgi:glycosyltransferase involved in cell wall biosynthesis